MERNVFPILLCLLSSVLLSSMIEPVDLPQTAYNEADTPINQGLPPISAGISVRSAVVAVPMLNRNAGFAKGVNRSARCTAHLRLPSNQHPRQKTLCSLLI